MTATEKKLQRVQSAYLTFVRAAEALLLEVNDQVPAVQPELPKIAAVQKLACDHFQISPAVLQSFVRIHQYVIARQAAMWLCREATRHSLVEIGLAFSGRDHGTVIWACRAHVDRMATDPAFAKEMGELLTAAKRRMWKKAPRLERRVLQLSGA